MSKSHIQDESSTQNLATSLEELIAQQGVTPITNLDELAAIWPADDDPDLLLQYLLQERAARKSISESNELR